MPTICRLTRGLIVSTCVQLMLWPSFLSQCGERGRSCSMEAPLAISCFGLTKSRIPLSSVEVAIIRRFGEHRCRCPRYSPKQLRDPVYINRASRFIRFLEDRRDIPVGDDIKDISPYLSLYADR